MLMIFRFLIPGEPLNLIIISFILILKTTVVNSDTTETYNWLPYVLNIPESNYDGYRLASGIQVLFNSIAHLVLNTILQQELSRLKKQLKVVVIHSRYQVILVELIGFITLQCIHGKI